LDQVAHIISDRLIDWYSKQKRILPWRENPDPYWVWLSEIILQQTRVAQGLPYFERFVEKYPTVDALAEASVSEVLKLWEGLGYYSRARNLHEAAQQIVSIHGGKLPNSYEELLRLKGIGPYTAAAIASICFSEPVPVIDGNVFRVVSRLFEINDDIGIPKSRKVFEKVLINFISKDLPGDFNQALMELGALICSPTNPDCTNCPLQANCLAYKNKSQSRFPVKKNRVKKRLRVFHYLVIRQDEGYFMKKRGPNDIWQGLYDFPLIEQDPAEFVGLERIESKKHILTHQTIHAHFYLITNENHKVLKMIPDDQHVQYYSHKEVVDLPKPKLIVNFLQEFNPKEWLV
jgi:A/G-specific adenine glycosylase